MPPFLLPALRACVRCAGPGGSVVYGVADTGVNVSMVRAPPTPDDPRGDSLFYRFFPR